MVDEISLIGWRNDIGAYLIMQYPRKLLLLTQDVMQIYTAHRQDTLYPNFVTLKYKGKKIASYFSGMKTTEFVGAPNFIVSLYLDDAEAPHIFRDFLPKLAKNLLLDLFESLSEALSEMENIRAIIILTKEGDIGVFPILCHPEMKITSKLKTEIINAHFKQLKIEKECLFEINGEKYASFFTGIETEKFLISPNYFVTFLLKEETDLNSIKRRIRQNTKSILSRISKILKKRFEEANERSVELMIEEEMKDSPILDDKDVETLAKISDEPEIIEQQPRSSIAPQSSPNGDMQGKSVDQILEKIRRGIQEGIEGEKELQEVIESPEELLNQMGGLKVQLEQKQELIGSLYEEIQKLNKTIKEKDQNIRKLMVILKSIRKYVSY